MATVNNISAPLKKLTTPGGLEWTYLMSANDEDELESIRRENQVHYNSYSAKSEWTKFVCTRNPTAQGNCRFGLLAMDMQNKQPMIGNARFHIYTKESHNHQVVPIKPTQKTTITKANSSTSSSNKTTQIIQEIDTNNKSKQMPIKVNENKPNNLMPLPMKHSSSMQEGKINSFEIQGKSLTVYNICHNFNDIESLRRAEGLLVDKQFNVIDGVPEKVSYRCKIDSKCPFVLHALHNKKAGFFELYAPELNIHVHNETKSVEMKSTCCQQNSAQDFASSNGGRILRDQKCEDVKMGQMADDNNITNQSSYTTGQPKVKLLQKILRSGAPLHSFPVNVNLKEWNFICDIDNEEEFEQLRKNLRVVSLQQNGKLFSTVRQQTLKCYRRISKKGKCPYRILLFRKGNNKSVNIYEKGKHNHFAPSIQLLSHQSTSSSSAVQKLDNSKNVHQHQIGFVNPNIIPQNTPNSINQFFMPPTSSSNNESLLRRVEETIGKMNSELESTKEERQQHLLYRLQIQQQQQYNFEEIFSIIDCQMELQSLAAEFQLEFSIDNGSILFKKYENEGSFIVLTEQQKFLNIDEYRNGTFNGQTERWLKGDPLQFIYAMRARVHEFILGKHFTYGRRF